MLKASCVRFVRTPGVQMLVLALALLSAHSALAATDWSGIQAAMGTDGFIMPGNVLRFELGRSHLRISVDGTFLDQVFAVAVTNGFVAFKETRDGRFYASGSLPAQASELSALQDSLLTHKRKIHITATYSRVHNISPQLIWVHFEASGPGDELATWLATALETIGNPQLGISVIPGTNSVFDPEEILPPAFLELFNEGFVAQVNDVFAFWLPRPDEHWIILGDKVRAQTGLGFGQTFWIQVGLSGGTDITINVDFALRDDELPAVQSILRAGGFTLPSLSNHYVDERPRLHYLHATASGNGYAIGTTLLKVVKVIERSRFDGDHDHGDHDHGDHDHD